MKTDENQNENQPVILLRAEEVAARLNISKSLAYRLIQKGLIPTVRINHAVRVRESDLNEYIQRSWSGWTN